VLWLVLLLGAWGERPASGLLRHVGHESGQNLQDEQRQRWDALRAIPLNTELRVLDDRDRLVDGRLAILADDGITIRTSAGEVVLPRTSVRRIERLYTSSRARRAKIGFLIGAAAGAAVGATAVQSNRGPWILMLGGGWGGIGAAIGAASKPSRRAVVVYGTPLSPSTRIHRDGL
jgi:hypothetical protein